MRFKIKGNWLNLKYLRRKKIGLGRKKNSLNAIGGAEIKSFSSIVSGNQVTS
jgi:hypothetical protein